MLQQLESLLSFSALFAASVLAASLFWGLAGVMRRRSLATSQPSVSAPSSASSSLSEPAPAPATIPTIGKATNKTSGVFLLSLIAFFLSVAVATAQMAPPANAVVRIPSHGGSGTVIATGEGWTLILSCAHCFEGRDRSKPVAIDMPHPAPGAPKKVGIKVLAVGKTSVNDLALLQINAGPVPYVSPVAPADYRAADCWSCGYDEMKQPAQCRPAKIVGNWGSTFKTDTRPWHGRSGGGLIDKKTGYLVGVCSAYTGPSNHAERHPGEHGIYVSTATINAFLVKAGVRSGQPPTPQAPDSWQGECPDGQCPPPSLSPQRGPQRFQLRPGGT